MQQPKHKTTIPKNQTLSDEMLFTFTLNNLEYHLKNLSLTKLQNKNICKTN
jgi:hypothetical protein